MRSLTRPSLLLLGLLAVALPALAQQPDPATKPVRLFYDLPAYEISKAMVARPGSKLEDIVDDVTASIRKRVGDNTKVERRNATVFTVEAADVNDVDALRRRIEISGTLEMRVLATDEYRDEHDRRPFDLAKEKERLLAWLDHGGRELLASDLRAIDRFLGNPKGGPLAGKDLCWCVHVVQPNGSNRAMWNYTLARAGMAVLASDAADFNDGVIPKHVLEKPREQQRLIELVPVNMREQHFDNRDLDQRQIRVSPGPTGSPCVHYRLRAERTADYGNWSEKHIGHYVAILVNGQLVSAPKFMSRIPGIGMIEGDFCKEDVEALADALRVDPLPVTPVLLKQESVGKR